jgi:hypothetical protein
MLFFASGSLKDAVARRVQDNMNTKGGILMSLSLSFLTSALGKYLPIG